MVTAPEVVTVPRSCNEALLSVTVAVPFKVIVAVPFVYVDVADNVSPPVRVRLPAVLGAVTVPPLLTVIKPVMAITEAFDVRVPVIDAVLVIVSA